MSAPEEAAEEFNWPVKPGDVDLAQKVNVLEQRLEAAEARILQLERLINTGAGGNVRPIRPVRRAPAPVRGRGRGGRGRGSTRPVSATKRSSRPGPRGVRQTGASVGSASKSKSSSSRSNASELCTVTYKVGKRNVSAFAPKNHQALEQQAKDAFAHELQKQRVFGHNGTLRRNVHVVNGHIVHVVGGVGVVEGDEQLVFDGHCDDITSIDSSGGRLLSAQMFNKQHGGRLCLWNDEAKLLAHIDGLPETLSVALSETRAIAVANDKDHTVSVYDIVEDADSSSAELKSVLSQSLTKHDVLGVTASNDACFVSYGKAWLALHTVDNDDNTLVSKPFWHLITSENPGETAIVSAVVQTRTDQDDTQDTVVYCGGASGTLYCVDPSADLCRRSLPLYQSAVSALGLDPAGCLLAASFKGELCTLDHDLQELSRLQEDRLKGARGIARIEDGVAVSTCHNTLCAVRGLQGDETKVRVIQRGHTGDVTASACLPDGHFVTCGTDGHLLLYSLEGKWKHSLNLKEALTTLDVLGSTLAVGTQQGGVIFVEIGGPTLRVRGKIPRLAREQISSLQLLSIGVDTLLFAGSWDQKVHVLCRRENAKWHKEATLVGHTSSVLSLQGRACEDQVLLTSCTRDYEMLNFVRETAGTWRRLSRVSDLSSSLQHCLVDPATWRNLLGWPVRGVFGTGDGTDTNSLVCANGLCVTGDDEGRVCLLPCPNISSDAVRYGRGHSSHVLHVASVTHTDRDGATDTDTDQTMRVLSAGGRDHCVILWNVAAC